MTASQGEQSARLAQLCRDFPAYTARFWTVSGKDGAVHPLSPNNAQNAVLHALSEIPRRSPKRLAALKYRQCGMSTLGCAKMQHRAMYWPGHIGLTIADKLDLPQQWLRRGKGWLGQTPASIRPHAAASNQIELYFDTTGSRYFIGSAEGKTPGVGSTLHWFHGSECALWLHPAEIERQTFQGIPTSPESLVLLESTGESVGDWWYQLWTDARDGHNDFKAVFLSWLIQDEYRLPADDIIDLTGAEQELVKLGADREQLAWRRWKIRNELGGDEDHFCNQFPHNPEVAFLAGGKQVFTPEQVRIAKDTIEQPIWRGDILPDSRRPHEFNLVENVSGELLIWEQPKEHYHYAIGADVQWGTKDTADYDAAHVECLESGRVCATIRGHYDMSRWGLLLAALGHLYGRASLAPERNTEAASGVVAVLRGLAGNTWRYPNIWIRSDDVKLRSHRPEDYGFLTNTHTKAEIIAFAKHETLARGFDWRDELCVREMASYIRDDKGNLTAPEGAHDDALMARMITAYVAHRLRAVTDLYHPSEPFNWTSPEARTRRMMDEMTKEPEGEYGIVGEAV